LIQTDSERATELCVVCATYKDILRLYVAMDNHVGMEIDHSQPQLSGTRHGIRLAEVLAGEDGVIQVSALSSKTAGEVKVIQFEERNSKIATLNRLDVMADGVPVCGS